MISCARIWSGPFGPDCKEKGLKIERVLFNIVIVIVDGDQDNHVYIIQDIFIYRGEI